MQPPPHYSVVQVHLEKRLNNLQRHHNSGSNLLVWMTPLLRLLLFIWFWPNPHYAWLPSLMRCFPFSAWKVLLFHCSPCSPCHIFFQEFLWVLVKGFWPCHYRNKISPCYTKVWYIWSTREAKTCGFSKWFIFWMDFKMLRKAWLN